MNPIRLRRGSDGGPARGCNNFLYQYTIYYLPCPRWTVTERALRETDCRSTCRLFGVSDRTEDARGTSTVGFQLTTTRQRADGSDCELAPVHRTAGSRTSCALDGSLSFECGDRKRTVPLVGPTIASERPHSLGRTRSLGSSVRTGGDAPRL